MRSVEFVLDCAFERTIVCVPFLGVERCFFPRCASKASVSKVSKFMGTTTCAACAHVCGVGLFKGFFPLHGYERDHAWLKGVWQL